MLSCEGVARCVIRQLQQLPSRICSSSLVVRKIKFQGVLFKFVSGKKQTQDHALNRDSGHSMKRRSDQSEEDEADPADEGPDDDDDGEEDTGGSDEPEEADDGDAA